jgi:hypothetical protein
MDEGREEQRADAQRANRPGRSVIEDGDTPILIATQVDVTLEALTRGHRLGRRSSDFPKDGGNIVIPG